MPQAAFVQWHLLVRFIWLQWVKAQPWPSWKQSLAFGVDVALTVVLRLTPYHQHADHAWLLVVTCIVRLIESVTCSRACYLLRRQCVTCPAGS
jgi:hypothetical protein